MKDAVSAAILARTYYHRVTAYRPVENGEEMVCWKEKCALSRAAHTSAPTPPDARAVLPEAAYHYALYTGPELAFRLGDRLEITDTVGRVYHGRASDSFCYPSHCVTVLDVRDVRSEAGQNARDAEEVPV